MKKRFALVLMAISISTLAFSQISWNVKAGVNLNNMTEVEKSKMKFGYHVGVGMDYAVSEMFSIQPSLLFVTKGFKIDENGYKLTSNPMYLQLPILAAAKFAISEDAKFVVSAGPYLAYGLGGKAKQEDEDGSQKVNIFSETDIQGRKYEAQMKRFDLGLNIGVGVELQKFIVGLNFEYGLMGGAKKDSYFEQLGKDEKAISPKNLGLGLSVGYKF